MTPPDYVTSDRFFDRHPPTPSIHRHPTRSTDDLLRSCLPRATLATFITPPPPRVTYIAHAIDFNDTLCTLRCARLQHAQGITAATLGKVSAGGWYIKLLFRSRAFSV